MVKRLGIGVWVVLAMIAGGEARADAVSRPAVVELFTSQGCSSCPPADALLGELARRPGVLALGFHINYWDSSAWRDPFSTPEATERQRLYARRFNGGQVYTPQMVVDGVHEMIGSDRAAVFAALAAAGAAPATAMVSFAGDGRSVAIGPGAVNSDAGSRAGRVLLVRFLEHRATQIGGGENASRAAIDTNAVEAMTMLGDWDGRAVGYRVDPPQPGEGIAVLVQGEDGHFLGAASLASGQRG